MADVTQSALPDKHYDLWHDSSLFQFLIQAKDRELYLASLRGSLKTGGHFVIAAFANDGLLRFNALDVESFTVDKLRERVGEAFELEDSFKELHQTPFGTEQSFVWARFRLRGHSSTN